MKERIPLQYAGRVGIVPVYVGSYTGRRGDKGCLLVPKSKTWAVVKAFQDGLVSALGTLMALCGSNYRPVALLKITHRLQPGAYVIGEAAYTGQDVRTRR